MIRFILILLFIVAAGCESSGKNDDEATVDDTRSAIADDAHNSRIALDWAGSYSGVLPCADCEGIRTSITLHQDGRFTRRTTYIGKSAEVITESGSFAWDDKGGRITLEGLGDSEQIYQVGEGRLFHLDKNGDRITGELAGKYVLDKAMEDPRIEGVRWLLIELNGQRVETPQGSEPAYFELQTGESRAFGHASCNRFFGNYKIKSGNRISFGENMGMTMMACPDMATEMAFMEVLRKTDNYAVSANELSLNRARMAPLARFSAVGQ